MSAPITEPAARPMTDSPQPHVAVTARALHGFMLCLGARENHEVYLSAPITTGHAYVVWRNSHGSSITQDHPQYGSLHYEHVISTNLTAIVPFVRFLRRKFPDRLVIDPTSLEDVPGWEQQDYHDFWCRLIEKYAAIVVFADGWQFSTGCVSEFATALRTGKQVYTQSFEPLTQREGLTMIASAIHDFDTLKVNSSLLRRAMRAVERATEGS